MYAPLTLELMFDYLENGGGGFHRSATP